MNDISPFSFPPEPSLRVACIDRGEAAKIVAIAVAGLLAIVLACFALVRRAVSHPVRAQAVSVLGPRASAHPAHIVQSTPITPIVTTGAPSSGMIYSGAAYDVTCDISGSVTLYPAVHNGTRWEVYQGYPQEMSDAIDTVATVTFPAYAGSSSLTWNAFKTGSGSVSSCMASGRAGAYPPSGGNGPLGTGTSGAGGLDGSMIEIPN